MVIREISEFNMQYNPLRSNGLVSGDDQPPESEPEALIGPNLPSGKIGFRRLNELRW